jgi:hypothetical protein
MVSMLLELYCVSSVAVTVAEDWAASHVLFLQGQHIAIQAQSIWRWLAGVQTLNAIFGHVIRHNCHMMISGMACFALKCLKNSACLFVQEKVIVFSLKHLFIFINAIWSAES